MPLAYHRFASTQDQKILILKGFSQKKIYLTTTIIWKQMGT